MSTEHYIYTNTLSNPLKNSCPLAVENSFPLCQFTQSIEEVLLLGPTMHQYDFVSQTVSQSISQSVSQSIRQSGGHSATINMHRHQLNCISFIAKQQQQQQLLQLLVPKGT